MRSSMQRVAQHRGIALLPLGSLLADYPQIAQQRWSAWLRKQRLDTVPTEFSAVLEMVISFAEEIITNDALKSLSLGSQVKENEVEPPSYGPCRALKCHDAARALRKRRHYETERGEPRPEARAGAWNITWSYLCESALYLGVSRRNIP
jgi:hypothetical protein